MANHLADSGPLPVDALRSLSYVNEKSARVDELELAIRRALARLSVREMRSILDAALRQEPLR